MKKSKKRFIYMFLVGIVIAFIMNSLVPFDNPNHIFLYDIFSSVLITFIIWEGSLRIDHYLNQKLPWLGNTAKRIFTQFAITLVFSSIAIYFPMLSFNKFVCYLPPEKENLLILIALVIGILISFFIMILEISTQFFKNWKKSLLEVEKYKAESIQAQLQNLKDQVNPHFLFNNLSVLSSLVYKDQDKAVDFINQMAKVYRYVLENQENELVSLEKELTFIESYIYLLKIRFDVNLVVKFSLDESSRLKYIPPMCLQLLVENCIKHNEVSEENPLEIKISSDSDYLKIVNNLQERTNPEKSSNTGLKNIQHRIAHFTNKEVFITKTDSFFEVKVPLLTVN
ncbi:MAG: histidine kinase [Bacteroidota bacterium]